MGYTNLREKKRKVGRKREENDSHGVNSTIPESILEELGNANLS